MLFILPLRWKRSHNASGYARVCVRVPRSCGRVDVQWVPVQSGPASNGDTSPNTGSYCGTLVTRATTHHSNLVRIERGPRAIHAAAVGGFIPVGMPPLQEQADCEGTTPLK